MDGVDYSPGPKPDTPLPILKTGKCLTTTGEIKIKEGFFFLQDEIVFHNKIVLVTLRARGHDSTNVVGGRIANIVELRSIIPCIFNLDIIGK